MITLRKLASLPDGTRRRKTLQLIRDFERRLVQDAAFDPIYLRGLLDQIAGEDFWAGNLRHQAEILKDTCMRRVGPERAGMEEGDHGISLLRRQLNQLGHVMAAALGQDWADWDAIAPGDTGPAVLPGSPYIPQRPFRVYLDGLRSPFNVGSVMRSALAWGIEQVWASPDCAPPDHRRARRSAMGAVDVLPWEVTDFEKLNSDSLGPVFALELGGREAAGFPFPASGTVIIGSEELGVRPELLNRAEESVGVVSIALPGPKASLNVGVAFGILLDHWYRQAEQ